MFWSCAVWLGPAATKRVALCSGTVVRHTQPQPGFMKLFISSALRGEAPEEERPGRMQNHMSSYFGWGYLRLRGCFCCACAFRNMARAFAVSGLRYGSVRQSTPGRCMFLFAS